MSLDNDFLAENIAKNLAWVKCWKQGPGEYGGLHLHPCWGESGVLEKKYQGITVSSYRDLVPAMLELYKKTNNEEFLKEAHTMIECLVLLQMPQGCLNHSCYEGEPGYGGLIHNAWGLLAIVTYMKFLKEQDGNNSYEQYKKVVENGLR